ncbi:MAG: TIGR01620 family protein [Ahrensia sp.]|nr:TIGR01620 family protein [Ahrensia sp.]
MSEQRRRAPRSFDPSALKHPETAAPERADSKQAAPDDAEAPKKRRKPKSARPEAVIRTLPDDAVLRSHERATASMDLEELTPPPTPVANKAGFRWARLFWIALGGLVSLSMGLWLDSLINSLFARQDWLGWLAVGLTALLVAAVIAIIVKEALGLARMQHIGGLREKATKTGGASDLRRARSLIADLEKLYENRPDTAQGRAALSAHNEDILDGRDLLGLAERDLLRPLDARARALVIGSAKRVSVVTAVSPRALIDVGFVLLESMRLIRRVADLYGGRPGTLGFLRLARNVIGHLAVTGSIAVGEGLVQQLVGHGVAARISTRLGEGVVNGLLTCRIGIAAIDVCRPLPFSDQYRPTVSDFLGELMPLSTEKDAKSGNKS